jgi:hypothetical protein
MFIPQHNKKAMRVFSKLVSGLNRMGITPIVYGSLGLAFLIKKQIPINDIDMILLDDDFDNRWEDICKFLIKDMKYAIDPEHKQEFLNDILVSFMSVSDIRKLTKINISQLQKTARKEITYYNLTLNQHLNIYKNGLLNKFRRQKKEKDDKNKIDLIRRYLLKNRE